MRTGTNILGWQYGTPVPHGIIREWHLPEAQPVIRDLFRRMQASKQTVLIWNMLHYEGGDGIALNSSDGLIDPRDGQNIDELIQLANDSGITEHLVRMLPEWTAAYNNWLDPAVMGAQGTRWWKPSEYSNDQRFAFRIHEKFLKSGVAHRMDWLAEGIASPGQLQYEALLRYTQRMWEDCCAEYGADNKSVGFSIIPTVDRVQTMKLVYQNGVLPDIWAIDPYANEGGLETTGEIVKAFITAVQAAGLERYGYVDAETFAAPCPMVSDSFKVYPQLNTVLWYVGQWGVGTDTPQGVSQDRFTVDASY